MFVMWLLASTTQQHCSAGCRGKPASFVLDVCFAEGDHIVWELISPKQGPTIFQEFLDKHGEGIHHIAFDCNNMPFQERVEEFQRRGFAFDQGGSWMGKNHFAFFSTEADTSTCFETYEFPSDWDYPEPIAWYPPRS